MLSARRPSSLLTVALCLGVFVAVTTAAANLSKPLQKEGVGKGYGSSYGKGGAGYGGRGGYGGGPDHYDAYNGDAYGAHHGGYGGGWYGRGNNDDGDGGYGHHHDHSYYPDHGPFYFHNKHHAYDRKEYGKEKTGYGGNDNNNFGKGGNSYAAEKPAGEYGKDKNGGGGYGSENNGYGGSAVYYKPRFYTRQYCRYAAAASDRACHFCCRVVARSSNTSPDEIVSAIFAFDPLKPTNNGAGFEDGYGGDEGGYGGGSSGKTNEKKAVDTHNKGGDGGFGKESSSIYQCVCCAPKHNNNHYNNYDNY